MRHLQDSSPPRPRHLSRKLKSIYIKQDLVEPLKAACQGPQGKPAPQPHKTQCWVLLGSVSQGDSQSQRKYFCLQLENVVIFKVHGSLGRDQVPMGPLPNKAPYLEDITNTPQGEEFIHQLTKTSTFRWVNTCSYLIALNSSGLWCSFHYVLCWTQNNTALTSYLTQAQFLEPFAIWKFKGAVATYACPDLCWIDFIKNSSVNRCSKSSRR